MRLSPDFAQRLMRLYRGLYAGVGVSVMALIHVQQWLSGTYELVHFGQLVVFVCTVILLAVVHDPKTFGRVAVFGGLGVVLPSFVAYGIRPANVTVVAHLALTALAFLGLRSALLIIGFFSAISLLIGAAVTGGHLPVPSLTSMDGAVFSNWVRSVVASFGVLGMIVFLVEALFSALESARGDAERAAARATEALQAERAERLARDAAEERQARTERALSLAQRDQIVARVAAGAAHDLTNVLTVIHGTTELVEVSLAQGGTSPAQLDEDLRLILDATQRASTLTRQLMGFSRHQGATSRAFDLRGVVEAITPLLERAVTSAVTLKHERAAQPFMLRGDSAQLEQVIMNLVLNARDAMPQGGQVVVRLADLTRDGVPGVALEVEDTGTGIAPEHRARVFEAFYTTKPEGKGTGLGLATVVSIVEAHGGQVDYDTELGRGTVFRVWLPTVVVEQSLAATDTLGAFEVTTAVRDGGAVLVVEDDPRILKNATRILRAAGHRVIGAASGTEAQRLAAETRFDVIVMDAVMPGRSGPELYAVLHAAQPRACVIVTTGFATNDFGRDFFDGGDRVLVQKPYGRADLVEVVRLAVNRARTPVPASVA